MRVRFPRLPDGRRAHCVVERPDGVRYRVREGVAGSALPHDLVHLVVERETGDDGGFWGAVAAGAVFASMEHLDGRRPPHVARRSAAAVRGRGDRLQRAELVAGLVEQVVRRDVTDPGRVRAIAREALVTLPDPTVDPDEVLRAADALRAARRTWSALAVGEEMVVEWRPRQRGSRNSRRFPNGSCA